MPRQGTLSPAVVSKADHDQRFSAQAERNVLGVLSTFSIKYRSNGHCSGTCGSRFTAACGRLQVLTVAWMSVEAIVALGAAWTVRSPALLGFGGDSTIELFSAIIVPLEISLQIGFRENQEVGSSCGRGLLFAVAVFVIVSFGLSLLGYREPQPSFVAMIVAATGMPWLASQKRKLATQVASASLSPSDPTILLQILPNAKRPASRMRPRPVQPGIPVSTFVCYLGSLARSHAARSPSRRQFETRLTPGQWL